EAKGLAEAAAVEARGRALEVQSQAILAQELIHLLPSIAAEYAGAISSIDNMTVVSADGTSKVAGDAMGNLKGLLEMARETVGVDLVGMLNGVVAGSAAGAAAGRASAASTNGNGEPRDLSVKLSRDTAQDGTVTVTATQPERDAATGEQGTAE